MNANLFNCEACGRVYIRKTDEKLCAECSKEYEELYFRVRRYLREHPNQNVLEIADALDVNVNHVLQLVGQGRLIGR